MENEAVDLFVNFQGRLPTLRDLPQISPGLNEFMEKFPGFRFVSGDLRLKYIMTRASAMDAPLERMRNITLLGRTAEQIYDDYASQRDAALG